MLVKIILRNKSARINNMLSKTYLAQVKSILKKELQPNSSKLPTRHVELLNAQMSFGAFQVIESKWLRYRLKQARCNVFRYKQSFLSPVPHRFLVQDRCFRLPTARLEMCQDMRHTFYFHTCVLYYHHWIK